MELCNVSEIFNMDKTSYPNQAFFSNVYNFGYKKIVQ